MKPKDYYRKVGQKIRQIRLDKGISQVDLAYACDMEKQSLLKIEKSGVNLTLGTMLKIADALCVEIEDLVKK